jgi:magnesium and cobalt transporter
MNEDPGSTNGPAHRSWWDRLGHLFSSEPRNRGELIEELRNAQVNGLLSNDTLTMVEGAIKVTELSVDDVMVPRAQIVSLPADAPLADILATVVESGHSRFPVHGEDKDEILGILLAKDLLKTFGNEDPFDLRALLRPAVLIPESMRLNVLLAEFRLTRNHMALVVDEYGGVAGLITIEDVLEQIVGEIDDEHDDEEDPVMVQSLAEGDFSVSALTPIADFNEVAGAHFSDEEFDTIGGMITSEFGHLPTAGEEIAVGGFLFRVTHADDRRVQQFHVTRANGEA